MLPLVLAAERGLPVVDADGMGRAFPQLEMETFNVYGVPAAPARAWPTSGGNCVLIETGSAARAEFIARGVTIRMGGQSPPRQLRHGRRHGPPRLRAGDDVAGTRDRRGPSERRGRHMAIRWPL